MKLDEKVMNFINPSECKVILTCTREELDALKLGWHDECQLVAGSGIRPLLKEAEKRLQETDYGELWSIGFGLKDAQSKLLEYKIQ